MPTSKITIPADRLERSILLVRGQRVILDAEIAELYGVATKVLNQAVARNRDRFPADFMVRLTANEVEVLNRSHFVTGSQKHRDPRYLPYAFTEQGVAMLAGVLRSKRAVIVNIEIMRAFVRLRQMLASNAELAHQLRDLEKKYDHQFKIVFDAIRELMTPPERLPHKPIGFRPKALKK